MRPEHDERHPIHVVLRRGRGMPSFRGQIAFGIITRVFRSLVKQRDDFRIAQFSVQSDHIHLVVEATDKATLSSGMRSLAIRIALRLNRRFGRRGKVWSDRYFRRDLTTRRQVRTALVYVLFNSRKHRPSLASFDGVDFYTSATFFDGWAKTLTIRNSPLERAGPLVHPARTALLSRQWRALGLLDLYEQPARV